MAREEPERLVLEKKGRSAYTTEAKVQQQRDEAALMVWGEVAAILCVHVLESPVPIRHKFALLEDGESLDGTEWTPVMHFAAFASHVRGATRYVVQRAGMPERYRIKCDMMRLDRDTSEWEDVFEFHAFKGRVPGATPLYQSWSSSPDRYRLRLTRLTAAGWTQRAMIYAFMATRFAVLVTRGAMLCRIVSCQHTDVLDRMAPGECILTEFYGLQPGLDSIPAAVKLRVQSAAGEAGSRLRVTHQAPVEGGEWSDLLSFYAFNMPVPGTTRYEVHVNVPKRNSRTRENFRVTAGDSRISMAQWRFQSEFYAFAPSSVRGF